MRVRSTLLPLSLLAPLVGFSADDIAAAAVQVREGAHGMVVAGHPQAAEAGVAVLRAGGKAVDAAVAVSLALGVAEPYGSGLGGKLALLYYDNTSGEVHLVDAMDSTGASFDAEAFRALGAEARREGARAVAIPGLPAGLMLAHERWGRLPRADVVAPAIALAREGCEILPGTVRLFAAQEEKLRRHDELARVFLVDGKLPAAGTKLRNLDLARTLEAIAAQGREGFYSGPVAEALAHTVTSGGGWITSADLDAYRATVRSPLRYSAGAFTIVGGAPPTTGSTIQGLTLLLLANRLWPDLRLHSTENLDAFLRAYQQANGAVRRELADTPDADAIVARLFSADNIAALRDAAARADPKSPYREAAEAAAILALDVGAEAADTTHFCVIDAEGNAVSATQSLSLHFGSGVLVPGTGVVLNNSLSNFAVRGGPNVAAANKRPRSTIAPTLVFRDDRLHAVLGLPGGARIPSGTAQVLLEHLYLGRDLDDAIAAPRVHPNQPTNTTEPQNVVWFESDPGAETLEALRRLGWAPEVHTDTESFGGLNAIAVLPDGTLRGIADLRRTNAAIGW